jgi:AcrR family transcriptional regulator
VSKVKASEQHDQAGASEEAPARGRGRPRSAAADQAILAATLRMVAEHGVAGTTIEGVAVAAGVGKTTIYRRWQSKTALIVAAVAAMAPRGDPPDTGSFAGDLAAFAAEQRERMSSMGVLIVAPRVLAEAMNDPELHQGFVEKVMGPIRRMLRLVIERGIEREELRADLDVESLVDILQAIPIYRVLLSRGDPAALEQMPGAYLPIIAPGILNSSSADPKSARPRSSGSSRARRARSG